MIRTVFKHVPLFKKWAQRLNNLNERTEFVKTELSRIAPGGLILDAGCGSQQFRKFCGHLDYRGQDFGGYVADDKTILGSVDGGVGGPNGYAYGKLDYVGDIWNIEERDGKFDAILCTEVFEHIPYPVETLKEFSRLLKTNGVLVLTVPSNCLRHMDPYFFYSGFSDRWLEKFLVDFGFDVVTIEPVGDYYTWLAVEMARTAKAGSLLVKFILGPAFVFFVTRSKTTLSVDTLCGGYHVVAKKR